MKFINILFGIICSTFLIQAQPFYDFHTVDNSPGASISAVKSIDMDGDTDIDVIALFDGLNELVWFEKQLGGFSSKKVIQTVFKSMLLMLPTLTVMA